jgi:hypothetical protein
MSGSLAANIVIPIISFLAVFGWVSLVLRASTHPAWKHKSAPPRAEVAGGVFKAIDGGRQLMPIPGEQPPEIPPQRLAAPEESYQTADAGRASPASSREAERETTESQSAGSGLAPR